MLVKLVLDILIFLSYLSILFTLFLDGVCEVFVLILYFLIFLVSSLVLRPLTYFSNRYHFIHIRIDVVFSFWILSSSSARFSLIFSNFILDSGRTFLIFSECCLVYSKCPLHSRGSCFIWIFSFVAALSHSSSHSLGSILLSMTAFSSLQLIWHQYFIYVKPFSFIMSSGSSSEATSGSSSELTSPASYTGSFSSWFYAGISIFGLRKGNFFTWRALVTSESKTKTTCSPNPCNQTIKIYRL